MHDGSGVSLRCHETSIGVGVGCNRAVVLSRWTRAEGPKCECAVVQSALVLRIWTATAPARHQRGRRGAEFSLCHRAISRALRIWIVTVLKCRYAVV